MKILVSACLLGRNCKYNGGNNLSAEVLAFLEDHEAVPVCPEELAGLGIPRTPVEIVDGVVRDKYGNSVDEVLRTAVSKILAQAEDIQYAILKSRSPTCGVHQVYDGTFTGTLTEGSGVLAQALMDAGVQVFSDEDLKKGVLPWSKN